MLQIVTLKFMSYLAMRYDEDALSLKKKESKRNHNIKHYNANSMKDEITQHPARFFNVHSASICRHGLLRCHNTFVSLRNKQQTLIFPRRKK